MAAEIIGVKLLVEIAMIVVFATLFNYIARMLKQPSLLAYIVAGIVIGPLGLGALGQTLGPEGLDAIWKTFEGIPIGISNLNEILILSELGIAFLLFSVGIESDLSKLKRIAKLAFIGTIIQVLVMITIVFGLSISTGLLPFREAIYLGVILAFSSTMVVVKILSDSLQIDSLHGNLMIAFLIVQDLLVVITLPFLENLDSIFKLDFYSEFLLRGLLLVVIALFLSSYVFPRIFKFAVKSTELLFLSALSVCFVFIFLSITILQMPMAIGAFIAGLSLSTLPYNLDIYNAIRGVRDFFVTIFFVTLGMQLTFIFDISILFLILFALIVTYLLKPVVFYFITLFSGHGTRTAFLVALGLTQVSEFSFIIANQGLNAGIVSSEFFSAVILVIAFSMVITPYFFTYEKTLYMFFGKFLRFLPFFDSKLFFRKIDELEGFEKVSNHVAIIGLGTMGIALAESLNKLNVKMILVDRNSDKVSYLTQKGYNILYGLSNNPLVWHKLNLEEAKLLVLSNPDVHANIELLKYARKVNPKIEVFSRAHYFEDAKLMYENGADYVCMPHVIGSNVMLDAINDFLHENKKEKAVALREEFYKYVEKRELEDKIKGIRVNRTDLID